MMATLALIAKRYCYRQGRQERKGIAKENQKEILAKLCVLRALGGGKALSPQTLAMNHRLSIMNHNCYALTLA